MEDGVSHFVYLVLSVTLAAVVFNSPYQNYKKAKTDMEESTIPYEESMFPVLAVCKIKGIKGRPDHKLHKIFRGWSNVSEIVKGNSYSAEELGLWWSVWSQWGEVGEVNRAAGGWGDFQPVASDPKLAGTCHALDLGSVVGAGGNMTRVFIYLNETDPDPSTRYLLAAYQRGDDMMAGMVIDGERYGTSMAMHKSAAKLGLGLTMKVEERIRDCEPTLTPYSRCLQEYRQAQGQDCGLAQAEMANCSLEDYVSRKRFLKKLHFHGYDSLSSLTGCRIPCLRMHYSLKELYVFGQPKWATGCFEVSVQGTRHVKKLEEVVVYKIGDFVSDLGGLSGLFLGFSLFEVISTIRRKLSDFLRGQRGGSKSAK